MQIATQARSRLSLISRDNRDTLFLLAVVTWTLAPHALRLPAWAVAFGALALFWRGWLAWTEGTLPNRFWLTLVLVAALALTFVSHGSLLGQGPGITLVVSLTALKTLELRARRDAFVVFFLGFFLILTQFMYSQSLLTALAMIVSIWGLLTALALAHLPAGRPPLRLAAGLAARAAAVGLPIMVVLFMLFPRMGPLWGRPEDAPGQMGLSGHMKLGEVSELAQDDSIAMRVRFLGGAVPRPSSLYFRGPVLMHYDGVEWREANVDEWPHGLAMADEPIRLAGGPVHYEVTIEPSRISAVALLEASPAQPEVDGMTPTPSLYAQGLGWRSSAPITDRLRITTQAWTNFKQGPTRITPALSSYLELPPNRHPRSRTWMIERMRQLDHPTPRDAAQLLMQHIRSEGYSYTLTPGTYGDNGGDAIDEFWMDRKAGFCEHYAAAFVVLMRTMGFPARIVTGYQGGELNPVDGYFVVRNRDAHAWAEYWQPGEGWVRADPTSAVSPDRVERGRSLRPQPNFVSGALSSVNPAWANNMRAWWDAANNRWNQWVLNYSQGKQLDLLKRMGMDSPDWTDLAYLLIALFSGASLIGALWAWWDRRQHDPWLLTYAKVVRTLNKAGADASETWPPLTLASYLHSRMGSAAMGLMKELRALDAQRYGRQDKPKRLDTSQARDALRAARMLVDTPAFKSAFTSTTAPPGK
jgi:transglutaminase-like putative cysteine protease